MSSNSDTPSENRPGGIGPGDRLQAARIEQGLSVEDIANKMHLSLGILEAIEENNFDDITAPIFVKGYLRAYARIVSLNEEEMIQQYVEFYSDEDPPITSTSSTSPEISSDDARVKWTTYIVILVLCGLLGAWWWSNNQKRDETISLDVDESAVAETAVAEPVSNLETGGNENAIVAASDSEMGDGAMDMDSAQVESETTIAIVEKQAEALDEMQVIAGNSGTAESNNEQPVPDDAPEQIEVEDNTVIGVDVPIENSESATEVTTQSIEPIQISPGDGEDIIELIIHADTWADIKDSEGNRLTYDLLRADRQLILTGQAPFSVFFGNGHGVEMTYNNEPVDLASHIRSDNTARLQIGTN